MKRGPGRPPGAPNRITATIREAALIAAERVGSDGNGADGLIGYLTKQATECPAQFLALLGKILPLQLTGDGGGAVQTVSRIEIVAAGMKQ